MYQEIRCEKCHKLFFEAILSSLIRKQHQEPGEPPCLKVRCHRCKHLNLYYDDPNRYVTK